MKDYSYIINLTHHVSKKHKEMSLYQRAAQFAPFAALTGYEDAIKETSRLTDKKIDLPDDKKEEINNILKYINENISSNQQVSCTYFVKDKVKEGGTYNKIVDSIRKIDLVNKEIIFTDKKKILITDIIDVSLIE